MRDFFEKRWWTGDSKTLPALAPFSKLFGTLSQRRAVLLKKESEKIKLPAPVVVVGNITIGGAGKTPILMALAESFLKQKIAVGIVSRGYARKTRGVVEVENDSNAENVGDEPLLLKKRLGVPVFVAEKRVLAAQNLLQKYPATALILSDDGLQHYALPRDFEIAVFDSRGVGNGFLLPRGPLREPVERLKNVDAILLNGAVDRKFLSGISTPVFESHLDLGDFYALKNPENKKLPRDFQNQTLAAVSGIGAPQRFFKTLENLGLKINIQKALPDHHFFKESDFEIRADAVFITEKDAVKCAALNVKNVWVLPVTAQIPPELPNLILEKCRGIARI